MRACVRGGASAGAEQARGAALEKHRLRRQLLLRLPGSAPPLRSAMLAADKDRLVAGLKQHALHLRQKELEYYVERYSNITTQASILAGFAFDSLVELEIPETMMDKRSGVCVRCPRRPTHGGRVLANCSAPAPQTVFYISASSTMALALYTVCVSSFATVYGHRLALQGPTGSVDRAVAVMMKQRNAIFVTFGLAMVCLVVAAVSMAWVKMDHTGSGETRREA